MAFRMHRRSFLRGAGGFCLALPALEVMAPAVVRAGGDTAPKRYAFFYGGISTGTAVDNLTHADMLVPQTVGHGYEMTHALAPVFDYGVAGDISVVTGLKIPWAENGGAPPPGGRVIEFHNGPTVKPQLCGMRSVSRHDSPNAPSSDQRVADAIAGDTIHRLLTYRVQPVSYVGGNGDGGHSGRISWADYDGDIDPVDPTVSPNLAYDSLFANFVPDDPSEALAASLRLRQRQSALDLVRENTQQLLPKLGKVDRVRMERHFDEIRSLEQRLAAMPPPQVGACMQLPAFGDDPPIGDSIIQYEGEGQPYEESAGYSDEDLRAELLCDLIHMAFACDLSRVASLQLTMWKCYMNMFQIAGHATDMHDLTHDGGDVEAVSDAVAWHVKHFARLTSKLADTPDVDGNSILDNTAMVLVFEGGHGYDPEGGGPASSHSSENMSVLVAGRAGGLDSGQHVVAQDVNPASVVATAMHAVGVEGGLGEVTDLVPELLG